MRKTTIAAHIKWIMAFMSLFFCLGGTVFADVSPGDVIDKTNWEKVKGMVPDSVLEWVKKGDFVLNIGKLNFDPKEAYPDFALDTLKSNVGKYKLNDKQQIVEAATGKPAPVIGIPFPKVDLSDPKAPDELLYNMHMSRYLCGHLKFRDVIEWIGRSGLERTIDGIYQSAMYTGYPETKGIKNPDGFQYQNIIVITKPFDVAGTAVMLWRYQDQRPDSNYSYVPAIRRVRRMSPASRSDAFVGSDFCLDDSAGYDGKVSAFEWKIVKTQDALLPYASGDYQEVVKQPGGKGVCSTKNMKRVILGYEKKDGKTTPWAMTNIIYVKRKVYVIEGKAKDPYYNYGPTYLWMDAERFGVGYKVIFDRANKYWKTAVTPAAYVSTKDGSYRSLEYAGMLMVDDRRQHATYARQCDPDNQWCWQVTGTDLNDYTLGGFQKYCK